MFGYILRRLAVAIPTLLLLIVVSFLLMHAAPGGPFTQERALPPQVLANLNAKYGLDDPLWRQIVNYVWGIVAHFDFGPSFVYPDRSVNQIIAAGFPVTLTYGAISFAAAVLVGVSLGVTAAIRQNSWIDYLAVGTSIGAQVLPNFVMAPILVLVFTLWLGWLPGGGWGGPIFWIMPVVAMSTSFMASIARITRSSMLEVLGSNHIRTARAKGLPERKVILRHALKPALLPVISYLGPAFVSMITGSVVVDMYFSTGGIGRSFVDSALNRDYAVMMGITILVGALTILFSLVVDVLYAWIDPKIRYYAMIDSQQMQSLTARMTEAEVKGRSPWADARRRFRRNKAAMVSLVVLILIVLFAVFGNHLAAWSNEKMDFSVMGQAAQLGAPSWTNGHYFGTDDLGRDLFSRTVQGTQVSLMVGLIGAGIAVIVGTLYGAAAGYVGGRTDAVMMRIVDILLAIPYMFVLILLLVVFGRSMSMLFLGIGLISWLEMSRIVRGQTLSLKNREFIEAARATGVPGWKIIIRHIVPNLLGVVAVYATLLVPLMILSESFISFLGLGVQEPLTSWGALISEGAGTMNYGTLWQLAFPLFFFCITLFAFFFVGDGLRDALDPKDR